MLSQRGDKSKGRLKKQAGEEQEQDGHGDVGTARSVSWRSDPEELVRASPADATDATDATAATAAGTSALAQQ